MFKDFTDFGKYIKCMEYLSGKYQCTIDLLFDRFEISCMMSDIFLFLIAKQTKPNQ
jgi:hypothetical protein